MPLLRSKALSSLGGLGALLVAFVLGFPGAASAQRLEAHEWGVWRVQHGVPTHLEDLARELPPFVHRAPNVALPPRPIPRPMPLPIVRPRPWPGPIAPGPGQVARKPVLFFYADAPTDVTVEVDFAGGEPWLYFPAATVSRSSGTLSSSGRLRWAGRVEPLARVTALAPVAPGHFWTDLRNVGAASFRPSDGSMPEQFLFYDGPVQFLRPFTFVREPGGARVTPNGDETSLWLVGQGRFIESKASRRMGGVVQGQGDMTALRGRLLTEAMARGLTHAEATSLLETWRDELFTGAHPRAIYFVPRVLYDQMLPLRITPAPSRIVRVGLVIELL